MMDGRMTIAIVLNPLPKLNRLVQAITFIHASGLHLLAVRWKRGKFVEKTYPDLRQMVHWDRDIGINFTESYLTTILVDLSSCPPDKVRT